MREVVIVPTYKRDDFLFCCLEAIRAAEPDIALHVFPDRGTDETEVCEKFGAVQHKTIAHTYHGNSYNMLEALKWAYQQQYELIFVIEDDAIIDYTFFSWAREALEKDPSMFAACGFRYSPSMGPQPGPDIKMPYYLSVCAAIPRKSLYGIVQHAHVEYYSDMKGYLDRAYPSSFLRGSSHYEQDGLVLRVANSESKRCVWPRTPRVKHIGFHGYHAQGKPLEGTLAERVAIVKLALQNPGILDKLLAGGVPPDVSRCEKCEKPLLSERKDARVVCVECWHAEHPTLPVTSKTHYYFPTLAPSAE